MADGDYVPYSKREEWKDIVPVKQDDGPNPVVAIAYTEKFQDVFDYFRAVLLKDERSERAYHLTTDAIQQNAANYTVWHFRRVQLKDLGLDLQKELQFTYDTIMEQPKNYQVWYHRQKVVEWLNDPSKELDVTATVLEQDAKNYHAWQHRQWAIRTFELWKDELQYVEDLISKDVRNNSAWNQRYFVVANTEDWSDEVIDREVRYALKCIRKAPNNESSWNYLEGVLRTRGIPLHRHPGLKEALSEMEKQGIISPFLFSTLANMLEGELEEGTADVVGCQEKALTLYSALATNLDEIRKSYWEYRARRLREKYADS